MRSGNVGSRFLVSAAAAMLSVSALAAETAAANKGLGQCELRIVSAATQFPEAAQKSGARGEVQVQVVVGKNGQVLTSTVARASGYAVLDRAAEQSVRNDWRFDTSHCLAAALPVSQVVSVKYRPVQTPFSASVNRRGIAYAKQAAADDQCSVTPTDNDEHLISCIQRATPSVGELAQGGSGR